MKEKVEVLIIGGGPGGLSIASLLAKEGVSSAIIESEPNLGGRLRSVNFHGCRIDNSVKIVSSMFAKPEDTNTYKFLDYMGFPPAGTKVVIWTMGLVSKDKPKGVDYYSMEQTKGLDNFFDFFAFAAGVPMEEPTRRDLTKAFKIMEDMSEAECRKMVDVSFEDFVNHNVEDELARLVIGQAPGLMGAAASDVNAGQLANVFRAFPVVGCILLWYPTEGTIEDMVIAPLSKYYIDHGGTVLTNRRARSILIENGEAKGVIAYNRETMFLEEYSAPVVICAIPIFQAVSGNILRREFLTEDWAEAVENIGKLGALDANMFYLLREEVIPKDIYGWLHIFDADYGMPTYLGDLALGRFFNVKEPPGRQFISGYVLGSHPDTPFGLTAPPEIVNEAVRRFEGAVTKAFPDFPKAIEHRGMTIQLNWGRYAWAKVPTEIDIQSPNIKGLFFAGDTVWSVSSGVASDKIYQTVFPLCEGILKYIHS